MADIEDEQLSDRALRSIWHQCRNRPRLWTNEEMQAVMNHLVFQRCYMTRNGLELPEAYDGVPLDDRMWGLVEGAQRWQKD